MNYESKYNELVEAVRAVVEGNPGLCNIDEGLGRLRELLPERESEDERIRREIRNFLIDMECKESWIYYLEKQKDAIGAARQQGYEEGLEDGIKMNMAEQMGESKEWADELSAEIDRISKRYHEVSFAKLSRVAVHFVRWQKEQRPTNSEKPKEWSEEDEKKYKVVLELINSWANGTIGGCIIPPNTDRYINWFKSLHERFNLQPKQEWNEEDEQWLESIIKDYEDSLTKDKAHAAVIKIKIDFLKSIRPQPHWKPSEEQITALARATNRCVGVDDAKILIKLLEQLEKL